MHGRGHSHIMIHANLAPVNVALIGCGNFARWQHLPNLHRLPSANLSLVCDSNEQLAQEIATRYGCAPSTNAEAIFADPQIEAVVLAVRDDLQASMCQQALRSGKHVYVEKPVGINPDQIIAVQETLEQSSASLGVGFQKRCAPAYGKAKTLLDTDGGVRNLQLQMCDDAWRWAHGYELGSLIVHDVCHLFDLARWLCDSDIAMIMARRSRPDDDAILLEMSNGCVVTIMASGHATMDRPKERLDAISQRGGVSVEDFVELRSYGYPGQAALEHFAGATHPEHSPLPHYLLQDQGAQGLASIRRIAWQLREDLKNNTVAAHDIDQVTDFVNATIPNFLRDQGWMNAMDLFLKRIRDPDIGANLAGIDDALAAATCAQAALHSINSGQPVYLNNFTGK